MQFIHGKPCPVCGGDINGIFEICPDCLAEPERHWEHAYAVFRYTEGAAAAIRRFKYGNDVALARPLGRLLAGVIEHPEQYIEIVPVPLHWFRFLQRGYNQSVMLGEELSKMDKDSCRQEIETDQEHKTSGFSGKRRSEEKYQKCLYRPETGTDQRQKSFTAG